jgi:hypothetical protein
MKLRRLAGYLLFHYIILFNLTPKAQVLIIFEGSGL